MVQIPGYADLVSFFRAVPSFHDAEILGVHINRDQPSTVLVRIVHPKKAEIRFICDQVSEVKLEGEEIGVQNVIFDLRLESDLNGIRMSLDPSYGLSGYLVASGIKVEVLPGASL
jgi:Immunity protein 50